MDRKIRLEPWIRCTSIHMHTAWQHLWIKLHVRHNIPKIYIGWHIWLLRAFEMALRMAMPYSVSFLTKTKWQWEIRIKYLISLRLFVWQIPKLHITTWKSFRRWYLFDENDFIAIESETGYKRKWKLEDEEGTTTFYKYQTQFEEIEEPYQCQLHDINNSYTLHIDHSIFKRMPLKCLAALSMLFEKPSNTIYTMITFTVEPWKLLDIFFLHASRNSIIYIFCVCVTSFNALLLLSLSIFSNFHPQNYCNQKTSERILQKKTSVNP